MADAPTNKKTVGDVSRLQARIVELENKLLGSRAQASRNTPQDVLTEHAELMHLYETAPVGLALIDADLRYVRVNKLLATINGVPQEEHIGRTVREVIPGIADKLESLFCEIVRTGLPVLNIEVRGNTQLKSDKHSDYLVSYIPIKNDAGNVLGVSKIIQDVSSFKYGGIALRESEARHRAVLAASLDPLVAINQLGIIQSASKSLHRVFGWCEEEVIGKNISLLMPAPHNSEHDGYLKTYRHTGRTWILGVTRELKAERKDGTTFPCEVSVSRVQTPDAEETLFAGIIRDISERKNAEKQRLNLESQLRQSQKMEAIGAMAGGIAHDFNNLLTAIYGYTSLLRTAIEQEASLDTYIDGIEKATCQATSLTASLLTFSRKSPASKQPSSVADILHDTIKIVRPAFPASVEVQFCAPENDDLWIEADASQIQQVFMNLVINARDAMPQGGTLNISCGLCQGLPKGFKETPNYKDTSNIFIEFMDTGMGMSEDVRNRIFEPFFTTKPRGQGTGLGMSVVYGIVRDHNGLIEIDSKESLGTTIRLLFHACSQPEFTHENQEPEVVRDGYGETILIVEDDQQVRAVLTTAMTNKGYHVLQAVNGEDALRVFLGSDKEISLVVLDDELPKRSGLSCLREFRRLQPSLAAIMITGNPAFDVKAISGSTVELLRKPFRVDLLTELIHKQLH